MGGSLSSPKLEIHFILEGSRSWSHGLQAYLILPKSVIETLDYSTTLYALAFLSA